jgi:presenilin-like A22 family membrane protease
MNVLWLFDTCGYVFGPAIMAAGVFAVALCAMASRPSSPRSARHRAVAVALLPAAIGLCGALFGLAVWWVDRVPVPPWLALGKVCLAGLAMSALPLIWSLLLARARRDSASPAAAE